MWLVSPTIEPNSTAKSVPTCENCYKHGERLRRSGCPFCQLWPTTQPLNTRATSTLISPTAMAWWRNLSELSQKCYHSEDYARTINKESRCPSSSNAEDCWTWSPTTSWTFWIREDWPTEDLVSWATNSWSKCCRLSKMQDPSPNSSPAVSIAIDWNSTGRLWLPSKVPMKSSKQECLCWKDSPIRFSNKFNRTWNILLNRKSKRLCPNWNLALNLAHLLNRLFLR